MKTVIDKLIKIQNGSEKQLLDFIFKNYFNEKDQIYLKYYMKWFLEKLKQREISVILNISQPYLNRKFFNLTSHLKVIINFITKTDFNKICEISDKIFSDRQKFIFYNMILGNSMADIARLLESSRANITQIFRVIKKKINLNKDEFSTVIEFFKTFYGY